VNFSSGKYFFSQEHISYGKYAGALAVTGASSTTLTSTLEKMLQIMIIHRITSSDLEKLNTSAKQTFVQTFAADILVKT